MEDERRGKVTSQPARTLTMYLKPLGSISSIRDLTFCLSAAATARLLHAASFRGSTRDSWRAQCTHTARAWPIRRTSQISLEYWLMRALSVPSHAALASVLASNFYQHLARLVSWYAHGADIGAELVYVEPVVSTGSAWLDGRGEGGERRPVPDVWVCMVLIRTSGGERRYGVAGRVRRLGETWTERSCRSRVEC